VQGESETLCSKSIVFVRYPFDEAAAIGISTIKQFSTDFKEVHFVLFADDIFSVWVNKAKEVLQKA
jgi:hypothetical protein